MRIFSLLVGMNLVLGVALALSTAFLVRVPASNCQFNGQPCSELSGLPFVALVFMPLAMFGLVALMGFRVKRHSPKLAVAVLVLPLAAMAVLVALNLSRSV